MKARWSLIALTALVACNTRKLRDDDLDVAAVQATFKCNASPAGDRAQACRMLGDFATAGPFTDAPTKSLETWFGRKVCMDMMDDPSAMVFGQIHLKPGVGVPSWPSDVKFDPARNVAFGAQFIGTSVGAITPPSQRAEYEKAVAAAEKGTTPSFANLDDFDRNRMENFWNSVQRPPGTTLWQGLVKTNGASIAGAPSTTDSKLAWSATYFVRQKDKRMLVVYPSATAPCVAELWKIHTE